MMWTYKIIPLIGAKSKLSTSNKLLIYETILKTNLDSRNTTLGYGSISNIEILELFQSKALRMTVAAPGMCQIRLSEGISKYQQLKKKSAATARNIVLASVHSQKT
jgi:hypothetical protein